MKKLKISLISFFAVIATFAQTPPSADNTIKQLIDRYENTEGVDCIVATKGNGLDLIKMMFNKQFGKSFMKGVTSITVIDYSEASEETCTALHDDLEIFRTILQEYDFSDSEEFKENQYMRCFASASDSETLSDFLVIIEEGSSKTLLYMAGKIVVN